MTTYQGHYLPVEARREVLKIYRDRRVNGPGPWMRGPYPPLAAMHATKDYFEGWVAEFAAFGAVGRTTTEDMIHRYRAARFYLDRMYAKPESFKNTGRTEVIRHLELVH